MRLSQIDRRSGLIDMADNCGERCAWMSKDSHRKTANQLAMSVNGCRRGGNDVFTQVVGRNNELRASPRNITEAFKAGRLCNLRPRRAVKLIVKSGGHGSIGLGENRC